MKNARRFIFNGKFLFDSNSAHYEIGKRNRHRYFDSIDDLCTEMKEISKANTSMGNGVIRDLGQILNKQDLIKALKSVKEGELVLVKTRYETIGTLSEYEKFTKSLGSLPGMVMVGAWTDDFSEYTPTGTPILLW